MEGWVWGVQSSRYQDWSLHQKRRKWSFLQEQISGVPWNLKGQHVELPLPVRAKGLWSHQVVLQGQKRPWNFILPTSCFSARAAAQASQSHQRVIDVQWWASQGTTLFYEQLNCVLITYFRVVNLDAGSWCLIPFSSAFLQGPIHVHPNELGVGYGLSLVPCECQRLISIYWK